MRTITFILLVLAFASCKEETPEHFGDFVDIAKIDKVEMRNNAGKFMLNEKQIELFKRELETLTPATGSYKTGGISMIITIRGSQYLLSTNTNGKYLECPAELISSHEDYFQGQDPVYFNMNGVNFDNFIP